LAAVEQSRIDAFAEATSDRQWIHIDPGRAAAGPSADHRARLLDPEPAAALLRRPSRSTTSAMGINYGLNRVRFPAPVPSAAPARAHRAAGLRAAATAAAQLTLRATIEAEGGAKPVCVAEAAARQFP
jgi:acyl dehydratase